jgi:hypothetical protein
MHVRQDVGWVVGLQSVITRKRPLTFGLRDRYDDLCKCEFWFRPCFDLRTRTTSKDAAERRVVRSLNFLSPPRAVNDILTGRRNQRRQEKHQD